MGLRFHKSIKLLQGIRLNISKTGPSLSIGGKGLTLNLGKKGSKTTVGLPGSGLSYSDYTPYSGKSEKRAGTGGGVIIWLVIFALIALVAAFS